MPSKQQSDKQRQGFLPRTAEVVAIEEKSVTSPHRPGDEALLQKIPFAVLLPTLGSTSHLLQIKESLLSRYHALKLAAEDSSGEYGHELSSELSLLTQTLQWLDEL